MLKHKWYTIENYNYEYKIVLPREERIYPIKSSNAPLNNLLQGNCGWRKHSLFDVKITTNGKNKTFKACRLEIKTHRIEDPRSTTSFFRSYDYYSYGIINQEELIAILPCGTKIIVPNHSKIRPHKKFLKEVYKNEIKRWKEDVAAFKGYIKRNQQELEEMRSK